jgi:TldD protein
MRTTLSEEIDPDNLITSLEHGLELGAVYVDIRIVMKRMSAVSFEECSLSTADYSVECGMGVRVFTKTGKGYYSTEDLSKEALEKGIESALKIADSSQNRRRESILRNRVKAKDCWTEDDTIDHMGIQQKMYEYLMSAGESDLEAKNIFLCLSLLTRQIFANSEGSFIDTEIPRTLLTYSSYRIRDGKMSSFIKDSRGYTKPLCEVEREIPQLLDTVNCRAIAARESRRVNPVKKSSEILLDSAAAGMILHEAIGHPLEADAILQGNSPFVSDLGRPVAPEGITITDDGTVRGLFGSYPFDADGLPSERKSLIEKGILKEYLVDLECGLDLDIKPNGSGRIGGFSGFPFPRSSNMFLNEGDYKIEELIEDSTGCLYVRTPSAAQISMDHSNFFLESHDAHIIEKGSFSAVKEGIRIYLDVRNLLRKITAVGDEMQICPNTCIKEGQVVPIAVGAPWLRLSNVLYLQVG